MPAASAAGFPAPPQDGGVFHAPKYASARQLCASLLHCPMRGGAISTGGFSMLGWIEMPLSIAEGIALGFVICGLIYVVLWIFSKLR